MQIRDDILIKNKYVDRLIELALDEDLNDGDITSNAVLTTPSKATAKFVAKAEGIIAGLILMPHIIEIAIEKKYILENVNFKALVIEGTSVIKGQIIAEIIGDLKDLLKLERTLLNFLSRISGVATYTHKMTTIILGARAKIYDTRKTLPGWRIIDKYAVRKGGGTNHRIDLGEYLLIKDNHLEANMSGVLQFLKKLDKDAKNRKLVEIEIDKFNYFKFKEIWNADIIMLDNMSIDELKIAINLIRKKEKEIDKRYEIEISGGFSIEDLKKLKELDVDRISIGKITHSASNLDISLDIDL